MRPIVLLDVDGPLADFTGAYLLALTRETGARHTSSEVDRWAIHECGLFVAAATAHGFDSATELRRCVDARVCRPGFCEDIEVHPGAVEAVARLSELGEVFVVTSPWDSSPTWMHERTHWIARHFPTIGKRRVIHTAQKHLVRGDVFLDDKAEHVVAWGAAWPDGDALLFGMRHNAAEGAGLRRSTWADAIAAAERKAAA